MFSGGEPKGTKWSRAMMMSAPSLAWTSTASSGLRKIFVPSRCEAKATPSSLTLANGDIL
jgi:hypothetical protein